MLPLRATSSVSSEPVDLWFSVKCCVVGCGRQQRPELTPEELVEGAVGKHLQLRFSGPVVLSKVRVQHVSACAGRHQRARTNFFRAPVEKTDTS